MSAVVPVHELRARRAAKAFDLPQSAVVKLARAMALVEEHRALLGDGDLQEIAEGLRYSVLEAIADGGADEAWLDANTPAIRSTLLTKLKGVIPDDIVVLAFPERGQP